MQHQGLYILGDLFQRHYKLDEVAELTAIAEAELVEYLKMPVLPDYVLEKLAAMFCMDEDYLLGLPDVRLN